MSDDKKPPKIKPSEAIAILRKKLASRLDRLRALRRLRHS